MVHCRVTQAARFEALWPGIEIETQLLEQHHG